MSERTDRLKSLARVQGRIRDLHEAKRANLLAQAAAAEREAQEIGERSYAEGSLSSLFPDLYARRVGEALRRRDDILAQAAIAAGDAAAARARAEKIGEAWREARMQDERETGDRERLEIIEQRLARR